MSGPTPDDAVRLPVSVQAWEHLTFLHWSYDPARVQPLVPDGLRVQQWEGRTWIGITPFRMAGVRPPALPPPPGWNAFPELNVRAYVRAPDGRDGIWFLGMVVPRSSFLAAARGLGLPYERSEASMFVEGPRWRYRFGAPHRLHDSLPLRPDSGTGPESESESESDERLRADESLGDEEWFLADTTVGRPLTEAERTPLVESITGRWNAYHRRARILWRTPVAHEPWPLHTATVSGRFTAPLRWVGLPEPAEDPLVHAAPAVHVRFGSPRPA